ncbi:hypothetical protein Btru_012860 [Bulinus truncatus]|nr:hypothetical protein Btru_012860 [Bulinus truncatus]
MKQRYQWLFLPVASLDIINSVISGYSYQWRQWTFLPVASVDIPTSGMERYIRPVAASLVCNECGGRVDTLPAALDDIPTSGVSGHSYQWRQWTFLPVASVDIPTSGGSGHSYQWRQWTFLLVKLNSYISLWGGGDGGAHICITRPSAPL